MLTFLDTLEPRSGKQYTRERTHGPRNNSELGAALNAWATLTSQEQGYV